MSEIDIEDFGKTVSIIENGLNSNFYEENFEYILRNKSKVLHEFNFINRMLKIAEVYSKDSYNVAQVHLLDPTQYLNFSTATYSLIQKRFKRVIVPIDNALGVNLDEIATSFYKLLRYNKLTRLIIRMIRKYA